MRFFSEDEVAGLVPELVDKLELARGLAGVPFIITSGRRSASENTHTGGVPTSAHLTGEAADLACSDSATRLKMVRAILEAGFTRVEIGTRHLHVDVSRTLPPNVMWVDVSH